MFLASVASLLIRFALAQPLGDTAASLPDCPTEDFATGRGYQGLVIEARNENGACGFDLINQTLVPLTHSYSITAAGLFRIEAGDPVSEARIGIWHSQGFQAYTFFPRHRTAEGMQRSIDLENNELPLTLPNGVHMSFSIDNGELVSERSDVETHFSKIQLDKDPATVDSIGLSLTSKKGVMLDSGMHKGDIAFKTSTEVASSNRYLTGLKSTFLNGKGQTCVFKNSELFATGRGEMAYFEAFKLSDAEMEALIHQRCPEFDTAGMK